MGVLQDIFLVVLTMTFGQNFTLNYMKLSDIKVGDLIQCVTPLKDSGLTQGKWYKVTDTWYKVTDTRKHDIIEVRNNKGVLQGYFIWRWDEKSIYWNNFYRQIK